MTRLTTERNAPCPCGSGKKFKNCCLDKEDAATSRHDASNPSGSWRKVLEEQQFSSLEEAQEFFSQYIQQQNLRPVDDFHALSPAQMHGALNHPFASPELVRFPEVLDTKPTAPILKLFSLLTDAIGMQGLKATATGNLPRAFCREAALAYWGEAAHQERTRYGGINREDDFGDLHIARLVAELAGLVRKYKGRFIVSRDCRRLLTAGGLAAVYPKLLRTYAEHFNWAYHDRYPELRFVQTAFLFTLYLLTRYGDAWRPQVFYEDAFLRAFPNIVDEVPPTSFSTPEATVRNCYTWRTLMNFAAPLGLAAVDPTSDDLLFREYRVKALPLLGDAVRFHLA